VLTALASAADYFLRFNFVANRRVTTFTSSTGIDQRSNRKAG
jgi:hypothetical protein